MVTLDGDFMDQSLCANYGNLGQLWEVTVVPWVVMALKHTIYLQKLIAINTGHAGREHIDMASDPGATTVRRSTHTHDREQTSDVGHTRPTTRSRPTADMA